MSTVVCRLSIFVFHFLGLFKKINMIITNNQKLYIFGGTFESDFNYKKLFRISNEAK